MFKHILVAYDGSEPAEKAFRLGCDLARALRAKLTVLAVTRPPEIGADIETEAIIDSGQRQLKHLLRELSHRPETTDVQLLFVTRIGHPAEQVLRYADEHHVDHLIVGHKGKGLLQRWLVGSVSRQIVDHAACSVTVVR
jgi:nucleotide-binding universal stress UspA family protein